MRANHSCSDGAITYYSGEEPKDTGKKKKPYLIKLTADPVDECTALPEESELEECIHRSTSLNSTSGGVSSTTGSTVGVVRGWWIR